MAPKSGRTRPPSLETRFDVERTCPNCGNPGLRQFYSVADVPVHCCLLMATRHAALTYPRGDVALGFCSSCGFITNMLFDRSLHEYSGEYEETQGFSPTFSAFARKLAGRLLDRWDLRGKTVIEIGCGKAEFLTLLCELGVARGIGFDPAYVPERIASEAASQINVTRDFFSEKHADTTADFYCCRHTLEHIPSTHDFVSLVRAAIGGRGDTAVFFEVPDATRILREGAFWDIYYEHCSYFSPGSLARLFRRCSFDLSDLWLDYDDQYVMLEAVPTAAPTRPRLAIEDDLAHLSLLVDGFGDTCGPVLERWTGFIHDQVAANKRVVLWGSSSKGVAFLTTLNLSDEIEYVVDINPYRQGKFMPGTGQEIVAPEFLSEYQPDVVIATNPIYRDEIASDLARLHVQALCVAL